MLKPVRFHKIDSFFERLSALAYPSQDLPAYQLAKRYGEKVQAGFIFKLRYLELLGLISLDKNSGYVYPNVKITSKGLQYRVDRYLARRGWIRDLITTTLGVVIGFLLAALFGK